MAEYVTVWVDDLPDLKRGEEIVRCRDCKHASEGHWPAHMEVPDGWLDCIGPLVTVWDYRHDQPANNPVRPDGFCAWGERRDV